MEAGKQEISLREAQQQVDAYIQQFKAGYFSPLTQMARLTEELGELAREVNHFYGEKAKKVEEAPSSVEAELADLLVVVLIMANSLDIDLTSAFLRDMEKFNQRDKYRFERKDGKKHD